MDEGNDEYVLHHTYTDNIYADKRQRQSMGRHHHG